MFVASANKDGLCLVAKHIFPFRQKLLHVSSNVLSHGNRNTVKDAYDKLLNDAGLYKLFEDCIGKGYCETFISFY